MFKNFVVSILDENAKNNIIYFSYRFCTNYMGLFCVKKSQFFFLKHVFQKHSDVRFLFNILNFNSETLLTHIFYTYRSSLILIYNFLN